MINFTIASNSDITNLKISDGAYRLYMLLTSMAYNSKIQVYPSQKYLGTALGRSVRTIQRYLKELKKLGYISIRRRGSTSSIITLLQKKTAQAIEKVKGAVDKARKAYNEHKYDTKQYTKKQSTFTDYSQRHYDFNKLEDFLLYGKGNYNDCLKE